MVDSCSFSESRAPLPEEKDPVCLSLSYIPGLSQNITRIWKRYAHQFNIKLDTNMAQRPIWSLRSFLRRPYPFDPEGQGVFKPLLKKFTCREYDNFYVGETSLLLSTRVKRHKADKKSALKTRPHPIDLPDFGFLVRAHDNNQRKILESLF